MKGKSEGNPKDIFPLRTGVALPIYVHITSFKLMVSWNHGVEPPTKFSGRASLTGTQLLRGGGGVTDLRWVTI